MAVPPSPRLSHLDRRGWWLWIVTFALLIALSLAVPALYVPLLQMFAEGERESLWVRDGYLVGIGISGLVLLFCLYTVLKQLELNRIRERMQREASELEDMRNRLSEVSALFSVSTTLNLQLRLDVILEIIVRRVVSTLRAQQASVMIYDPETGVLETRASYGLESEFARHGRQKLGEGIAGWVAERKEAVLLGPQEKNETFRRHYKVNRNISSALSLPLRVGDRCVGVLNVNRINHPEPFHEHHRDTLRLFAEHVGSVIERADVMERLSARTRTLEESNFQLSELNRMKDVFLSTASHELKTPLTSVIAYAELLEERKLAPAQQGEFLRRLRTEAGTLMGLIDDILDLSRLETGKMVLQLETLPFDEVAHAAVETVRGLAEKHDVSIVESFGQLEAPVRIDDVKIRQAIVNLLGNAIKYSPSGGRVDVRSRLEDAALVLEVVDRGPGVRPEDAVQIFELFGQGLRPPGERAAGGIGIGLHLVKRIVELHGGHVGVNSEPGKGSTFWMRLPRMHAAAAEQAA